MPTVTPRVIREAIGCALRDHMNSDAVEEYCIELGLDPPDPPFDVAYHSKRGYVVSRLQDKSLADLVSLALRVDEELDVPDLRTLVSQVGPVGVDGQLKNIIFAADGPKPRIVFSDAINNDIAVIENEQYCLVYDRPLSSSGLTWGSLVDWWKDNQPKTSTGTDITAARSLYRRLARSLANEAEELIFRTYAQRYVEIGDDVPALLPQVYLHYDPYTRRELLRSGANLPRQRMDFLLLMPNRIRIVLELDGIQHYATRARQADPGRYAEMVAEDRHLRLRGYEVYRFGGAELTNADKGSAMLTDFFRALSERYQAR